MFKLLLELEYRISIYIYIYTRIFKFYIINIYKLYIFKFLDIKF